MEIQGLIFDLGGTLIEYAGPYARWPDLETPGLRIAHKTLHEQGVMMPPLESFCAAAFDILPRRWQQATRGERNLRLVDLLAELLAQNGRAAAAEELLAKAAARYEEAICGQAQPLPAARETLALLQEQGYKMGLLSNTMFTGAAHVADLKRFGLHGYFDALLFSADAGQWKPNPEPYRALLAELDLPAARTIFIGDDPANDIVGAHRAGLRAVHVRTSDRFLPAPGVEPDATIEGLAELPGLLDAWQREGERGR